MVGLCSGAHALFDRGSTAPGGHVWYDGAEWQQEDLPADTCVTEQFGVDGNGTVHLLCETLSTTNAYRFGTNPGWSAVEAPAVSTVPNCQQWSAAFAVARDGTAYVLTLGSGAGLPPATYAVLLKRAAAGGWSEISEELAANLTSSIWMLPAGSGHAAFLYATEPDGATQQIFFVQQGPAGLGAPELVAQRPRPLYGTNLAAAISDDGTRVHVLLSSDLNVDPLRLYVRTATGWQSTDFAPSGPFPTGYGPDGKGWALASFDPFEAATPSDHALWIEK